MNTPLRTLLSGLMALVGPALVIVPLELLHADRLTPEPPPAPRRIALERGGERRAAPRPAQPPAPAPEPTPVPEVRPTPPGVSAPSVALPPLALGPGPPAVPAPIAAPARPARPEPGAAPPTPVAEAAEDDGARVDAAPAGPAHADGVDRPPRALPGNLAPAYPARARRRGQTGQVRVRIVIDERGLVSEVRELACEGPPELFEAVRDAVWRWRFEPARDGGRAIAVYALKTFRFDLTDA